jgi:D-lactate dehydrogenase
MEREKNIYFLEVTKEDQVLVSDSFPEAKIIEETLTEYEIITRCSDAEVLCVFVHSKISKKVIESLQNLKMIVTRSVGYDHIDLQAAQEKNIIVANVPDYGSYVISEFVFALLLSGLRHVGEGDERVEKKEEFTFTGLRGVALKGKTLGVIGTGKIGRNVARIASLGFLMNVLAYDAYPNEEMAEEMHFRYTSLDEIWKMADIISLHCPLLEETKHLVNDESITKMKDGVIIVNTSRGGIIDTSALIKAIKNKKVSRAFLDVLEHEENIATDRELINLPGVITTPHIAFYADDSMKKMYEITFLTIKEYFSLGKISNKVTGF